MDDDILIRAGRPLLVATAAGRQPNRDDACQRVCLNRLRYRVTVVDGFEQGLRRQVDCDQQPAFERTLSMRAILVAIVLALASPAMAAQNGLPLTGHPKQDFNNIVHPDQGSNEQQQSGGGATSGSKCTAKNLLECLGDDIINKISPDLEYADALAHQNNNKITAPCLDAILALIQGWQAQVYPIGPDGKPATT